MHQGTIPQIPLIVSVHLRDTALESAAMAQCRFTLLSAARNLFGVTRTVSVAEVI